MEICSKTILSQNQIMDKIIYPPPLPRPARLHLGRTQSETSWAGHYRTSPKAGNIRHPSSPTTIESGPLTDDLAGSTATAGADLWPALVMLKGAPLLIKLRTPTNRYPCKFTPTMNMLTFTKTASCKTEMQHSHAEPGVVLFTVLSPAKRPDLRRPGAGRLESCLHQLPVKAGDAVFIPLARFTPLWRVFWWPRSNRTRHYLSG
jgi:hypothetical protein